MENVGTISYKVTIDKGTFKADVQSIDSDLKDSTEKADKHLGLFESNVGKKMMAIGRVIATTTVAAGAAFAAFSGKVLMSNAELEQQLGGSEAVFEKYASDIQNIAKTSYKKAGLSQAEFLAGANKMGSLYQGAGISVEKSMKLSADAMQRASDVASIMGIDTTFALESVAGMAKGNFTMMDNLGVAMNDTAINAYALEKGIGKTTDKMSMAEKVGLATQMFMEKTAKYAGNYAKENDTLAGSLNTTKKAFGDFLTGTLPVSELLTSVKDTAKIAAENFVELSKSMGADIYKSLPKPMQQFIDKSVEIGRKVGEYLIPKFETLWDTITTKLIPALSDFWHKFIEPLLPVLGVTLVVAIGLLTDTLNLAVGAVSWFIDELSKGNPVIWGLIGAMGVFAGASALGAVSSALTVMTTTTIPGVMAAFGGLSALVASPLIMPAIAIGAALAAIATVWNEYNRMMNAIDSAKASYDSMKSSDAKIRQQMVGILNDGVSSPARKEHARKLIKEIDSRFIGGSVSANSPYLVGENPDGSINRTTELFVPRTSGYIMNSKDLQSAIRGGDRGGGATITNNYVVNNQADAEIISRKQAYAMGAI